MVPGVDDAGAHMFALGGDFVTVGGLFDVDGEFLIGPGGQMSFLLSRKLFDRWGKTHFVCSIPRTEAIAKKKLPKRGAGEWLIRD